MVPARKRGRSSIHRGRQERPTSPRPEQHVRGRGLFLWRRDYGLPRSRSVRCSTLKAAMTVPTRFPKEPRATERCGDSYQRSIVVTGEIPGTNFGDHLKYSLIPIFFRDGDTQIPPLFESRADLDAEIERPDGLSDLISQAADDLDRHVRDFSDQEANSLWWLINEANALVELARAEGDAIVPPALPGADQGDVGGHREKAQAHVRDALHHLRCAEYWLHRVILVRQAIRERPLGFTTAPAIPIYPSPESLPTPTPPVLPPAPLAPKRSYIPYVAAGAGTLLLTGIVYVVAGRA